MKNSGILTIVFISLLLLNIIDVSAQAKQESFRTSQRQVQISELASREIQILLPGPMQATIYSDGETTSKELNYNLLFDLFFTTDRRGNQEWVSPSETDSIKIDSYLFVLLPEDGYFEKITDTTFLPLHRKHTIDIFSEYVSVGAYGTTDQTASIEIARSFSSRDVDDMASHAALSVSNPGGQEMRISLTRTSDFHILQDDVPVKIHNRRALTSAFSDHRGDLRRFVRRNDIDFNNEDDLIMVIEYLETLNE